MRFRRTAGPSFGWRWRGLLAITLLLCAAADASAAGARRTTDAGAFLLAAEDPARSGSEADSIPTAAPSVTAPARPVARPPAASGERERAQALERLRRDNRSAKTAIFMSAVVPGWGQLYADSPFWSVVAFAVQMYYVGNIVMEGRRAERESVRRDREEPDSALREARTLLVTEHRERARDYVWWGAGGLLIIALDAYVSVELADFDNPYPPTPDLDKEWDREDEESSPAGAGLAVRLDFAF